jgi:hypothetical protein
MSEPDPAICLRVLSEFEDVMEQLGIEDYAMVKNYFRKTMTGSVRKRWDAAADKTRNDQSGWNQALNGWLSRIMITDDDFNAQTQYMETASKPYKMSAADLWNSMETMETLMRYMPRRDIKVYPTASIYTEDRLKQLLYQKMPQHFIKAFTQADLRVADMTALQLVQYFDKLRKAEAKQHEGKKNDGGGHPNHKRKHESHANNPNKKAKNGNGKRKKLNNPCRYHKTHEWADCFGNTEGKNYKPGFEKKLKKTKDDGADAHMIDTLAETTGDKETKENPSEPSIWDQHIGADVLAAEEE